MRFSVFQLVMTMLLSPACWAQSADPSPAPLPAVIELVIGHNSPRGSIYDLEASEFARRVNMALRGRVVVKVAGASQLGNDVQMLEKVQRGELDFAMPSTVLSSVDPAFSVFEVPYLVLSRDHVRRARSTLLDTYLKPAALNKGYLILGMWENGFRHVTNNVRPVRTPQDLKGMKIRVPQGSRLLSVFKSYGAEPEAFPFGQPLVDAIRSGRFDGQENPHIITFAAKLNEVQKYLSVTSHNYLPVYLVSNSSKFAELPLDVQKTIKDIAERLQDWALDVGSKLDADMRERLSKTMVLNEVDTVAFLSASYPSYLQFARDVPQGKALIKLLYDPTTFVSATGRNW